VTRLTLEPASRPPTHSALLGSSLAEIDGLVSWCSYRLGPPPEELVAASAALSGGWLRCSDALDDGGFFAAWQRSLTDRMAQGYGVVPPVTPAGYIMGWYCGMFGFLGGMLFHRARRVPSLAPENLAFRVNPVSCRPAEVALLDDGALAAMLRAEVAAHGERFVTAYRGVARFGSHTLWGAVTDALDRGVWHIAHLRGEDAAGAADAALVLPAPLAPFTSGSTIRELRGPSGRLHWIRTRQSCCFHYKLPGVQAPCATCPRLTVDQRLQRLGQSVSP
jgi:FhuF 2Fe-2S C-terminal domain